jgi:hypothetical protein
MNKNTQEAWGDNVFENIAMEWVLVVLFSLLPAQKKNKVVDTHIQGSSYLC